MERLISTLDFLFGCHHGHLSRVFTIDQQSYRVCCGCGKKFNYSLKDMCMEGRLGELGAPSVALYQETTEVKRFAA